VFAAAVMLAGFMCGRGRIVNLIMLFACVAFCSTGCVSAGLLSLGTTSGKVFGDKVFRLHETPNSREQVERYLGAPVLVKQLSALPSSEEFSAFSDQLLCRDEHYDYDKTKSAARAYYGNLDDAQKRSQGRESKNGLLQTTTPFLYARYNYKGRLISRDLIGEYFGWGVMTFGIREFVHIPRALRTLATGHKRMNYVSVWYDDGGRVVAYAWAWHDFSDPSSASGQEQN